VRCCNIDIVDAVAEIRDQPELAVGLLEQVFADCVGNGRHEHVGRAHRLGNLLVR
jgi:hypothetical protein